MLELRDLHKRFRAGGSAPSGARKRLRRSRSSSDSDPSSTPATTRPASAGVTVALDGLSLSVAPGRIVGFVGSNGAGKTTAMRIALGVLEPDTGTVLVDGHPAAPADRRRFGYMPEERGLYPKMRVGDQVRYLARLHGLPAADASQAADHWLQRLGVAARREDRVEALSLGNQQRVQLAAALVHRPRYLILDEPFSGLDPLGVDVMSQVLRDVVAEGAGVVFSSHQLELVERLCDEVVIIRAGRVVAAGPVADLTGDRRTRLTLTTVRPPAEWLDGSAILVRTTPLDGVHETVLEVPDARAAAAPLRAAAEAGQLLSAVPHQPTLAEVYREVVAP